MSDTFRTALITGGFMLAVVVFNELFAWHREVRGRKKAFFKDFFPERLQAHKEVLRAITEIDINEIDPEPSTAKEVAKTLEIAGKRLAAVHAENRLFMDDRVYSSLGNLWVNTRIAGDCLMEPIGPIEQAIDKVALLQDEYYAFIKLLREKSGVDVINEEFAKVVKGRKKPGEKKGAGTNRAKRD
jgi:hypothetical protein